MKSIRKVCVVVTARPSYSRVKTVLRAIDDSPDMELQLVVAASALLHDYGETISYIEQDGFQIDARVFMVLEGENLTTMAKTTGLGLIELATVFDNLRPDVIVTIADRYETMATAVAASYMNIPLAHIQGGEVTGSIDEKVRHAVTKLSDIHLVSTEMAAERVIRMGEDARSVLVTGCPSIDLAAEVLEDPVLDFDPRERYGGVGAEIDPWESYLMVLHHPVTTEYSEARAQTEETLEAVIKLDRPTLWFWPNVDAGSDAVSETIRSAREAGSISNVRFYKNMRPHDFLRVLYASACIVGNSSVAIRECSFLGVPAVNVGNRQSGRDRGRNVIDVPHDAEAIVRAVERQIKAGRYEPDAAYGDGRAGQRIAEHLASCSLTVDKRLHYEAALP